MYHQLRTASSRDWVGRSCASDALFGGRPTALEGSEAGSLEDNLECNYFGEIYLHYLTRSRNAAEEELRMARKASRSPRGRVFI